MAGIVRRLRGATSMKARTATADALVALLVPVNVALAGLVIGDALPVGDNDPVLSGPRLAWLAVGLLLLTAAVVWRRAVYRGSGTLFSVQLLDEEMIDRHRVATERALHKHMSAHVLTRWCDSRARTSGGVVELVDVVDDLGRDLAAGLNQDRDDTGYAIAPNMLWPAAVGVGRWLNRVEDIRFVDFGPDDTVEFRLADRKEERVGHTAGEVPISDGVPGRLGVWLAFTEKAAEFSADEFAAFGVSSVVVMRRVEGKVTTPLDGPEMCRLAADLASALADLRRTTPVEREIVVVAMIPKTVALLLGWHLSQEKVRFFTGTHLMHYDEQKVHNRELNTPYLAMRVHPSQPRHFPAPTAARPTD